MNEALGNALLFKLAIGFILILSAIFLGSFAYSKAFKVNNRIIEEIEKNGETSGRQTTTLANALSAYNNDVAAEIERWLVSGDNNRGIGYRVSSGKAHCNYDKPGAVLMDGINNNYEYCVYQINTCHADGSKERCGVYYHVITYMYVDFPLLELFLIPVHGETRTFEVLNS